MHIYRFVQIDLRPAAPLFSSWVDSFGDCTMHASDLSLSLSRSGMILISIEVGTDVLVLSIDFRYIL